MWYSEERYKWKIYRLSWTRQHQIVTYYYNVTKNLKRLCLSAKYTFMDRYHNVLFFKGTIIWFWGGGGGGLALFGNKYYGLKKLKINNLSASGKKIISPLLENKLIGPLLS